MTTKGYYTGIGSRQTPPEILTLMSRIATSLGKLGWTMRTGGADGADAAFLAGCQDAGLPYELYLPWKGFNGHDKGALAAPVAEAFALTSSYHPAWEKLGRGPRALHARNAHCVLGKDLKTPSRFVICWTPRASGSGGTGQALRIAAASKIQVFDLADPIALRRLESFTNTSPSLGA